MSSSRRTFLAKGLSLASGLYLFHWAEQAHAAEEYVYDRLGRLVQIVHGDGSSTFYAYDKAGNRTAVTRGAAPEPEPEVFRKTIVVPSSGSAPINLRTLANSEGFNGAQSAEVIFQVPSSLTITGTAGGGIAIDTGTWPTASHAITLKLQISGKVRGGGGTGGKGAGLNTGDVGANGLAGGDAVYCRAPIAIEVKSGGELKSGGGGGGGGAQYPRQSALIGPRPGSGGGGGFPNGVGGAGGASNAPVGVSGTDAGGGQGGIGVAGVGGPGGTGGNAGSPGSAGGAASGGGTTAGAGGGAGYAVRKNGNQVSVVNSGGTISGIQG